MKRSDDAEKTLHNQENILPTAQLLVVFGVLALVLCVCFMDQNGISVALPTIAKDLNAQETISWAGTSSLIANTVFSVLYGRLSDIFGRKVIFLSACALLALGDLLCGLAQDPAMLYVFRAVAGLAGGGITNLTMIIVSDVVTLKDRGKFQGILGACVGLGNVAGPFVAAAFIENTTWRAFFYLLAPLVALCGVAAMFLLPSTAPAAGFLESARKIDHWGTLTSAVAVIFLLVPISGGGAYFPWASPMVIAMLAIGSSALVLFVGVEWKVASLPMMPVQIFGDRVVATLLAQSFLLGWVYQSYLYYLPMYYQNVRGYSAVTSAALTIPIMATQAVASIVSGQYMSRRGRYGEVLWVGFGAWTLGSGLTILFNRTTSPAACAVILCVVGFGVGNVFQPTLVALQAHSPKARRAVIVSNRNFFRCCGGACGLAVAAAVLQASLRASLPARFQYLAESTYARPNLGSADMAVVLDAYMKAMRNVFIIQVPLIGLCLLGCLLITDQGLERPDERPVQAVQEDGIEAKAAASDIHDGRSVNPRVEIFEQSEGG
ncbi:hypothetical protein A1O1_06103 [Capronia coronata CBS 617.96]|uniref:Major facilitator superfamily (MFS) profile domain-containing protein n=1 Tax=Capronia coronata CBS 617.96 TaxID=1182541 RepID=W9Y7X0_9EURO|nr:uncharacterized protein A1O1_06103 [Capronia coronata CBS 617.96]EXJ85735.1 hypothetical protein A1O1_06103 [Capronia coronata CBS 617.96]